MNTLELIRKMLVLDHSWQGLDVAAVVNPFSGSDWVHFNGFEHKESHDEGGAWHGRGDAYKLHFYDENGGVFSLCFGFHKGHMYAWVEEGAPDEHPFYGDMSKEISGEVEDGLEQDDGEIPF